MLRRFLIAFALWTFVAILFTGQLHRDAVYAGNAVTFRDALLLAFTGWYAWALLYPLVAWLARRFRMNGPGIAVHAILSIVFMYAKIAIVTEVLRGAGMSPRTVSLLVDVPVNLAAYWLIAGVTWTIDANVRAARLESTLAAARLDLLRTQLQPHFLFNTLHGIAELMHEDVDAADRMIARLSDLLRATLETGGKQEVSLRDELSLLERYIDIQRMRLGDRLRFSTTIDPHVLDRSVPMLLLQPLIENSVRHAITDRREGGRIVVRAREDHSRLTIEVEDDGPGFREPLANGVGLANVRDRLQYLYGERQSMQIAPGEMGGGMVRIEIAQREHGTGPDTDR